MIAFNNQNPLPNEIVKDLGIQDQISEIPTKGNHLELIDSHIIAYEFPYRPTKTDAEMKLVKTYAQIALDENLRDITFYIVSDRHTCGSCQLAVEQFNWMFRDRNVKIVYRVNPNSGIDNRYNQEQKIPLDHFDMNIAMNMDPYRWHLYWNLWQIFEG